MPPRALPFLAVLAAGLALGACGRRGPLESPGAAAAAPRAGGVAVEGAGNPPGQAQVDDADSERDALVGSPIPAPPRGARGRAYTVPRTAFPLDPLL